ncbi:hypothetical protein FQN50_001487 [Emmonsiellopsis sp. PD_5]|nr:hypothetical protein FQN50_001487 [Emmonsiellopsis sp. PD_5]
MDIQSTTASALPDDGNNMDHSHPFVHTRNTTGRTVHIPRRTKLGSINEMELAELPGRDWALGDMDDEVKLQEMPDIIEAKIRGNIRLHCQHILLLPRMPDLTRLMG